ncbi:hypothetical protein Dsin_004491 [Dipteronia sinensis]|uniref:RNase H type-1 domain-containing protein n=1 Tax=Dipteronia sinensis TaxID=43782 RepID=A0AAE0AW29_9ROSI|nr:hypothetical protein Dsin_004491 [Dipteronia sinensis]
MVLHDGLVIGSDKCWDRDSVFLSLNRSVVVDGGCAKSVSMDETCWVVSEAGFFKLHVDATFDVDKGKVGLGVVIRNNEGLIIVTAVLVFVGVISVDVAESKVVFEGLLLAIDLGLSLIVESDALGVVKLCNGETTSMVK